MDTQQLTQNIIALRKRFGLRQQHLADRLDISRSTLAMYETGRRDVPPEKLRIMADLFGVTVRELRETDLRHEAQIQKKLSATLMDKDREELNNMSRSELTEYALGLLLDNKQLIAELASYRSMIRAIKSNISTLPKDSHNPTDL
ncbi:helix-turn-helix domain-containing protein [Roseivirga sp. BDSF3-8]|uniref:helix-turn-helix domain-containing protein n=1 Tax=Roseivirga sp. BDSF3-8 TaxID=3241598 RepID=UPI003531AEB8